MPRPQLKDHFLKEAFLVSKLGTRIIYYGFCNEDELSNMLEQIHQEAQKYKRKIEITDVRKAGDIAPYKYRYRIDMKVKN